MCSSTQFFRSGTHGSVPNRKYARSRRARAQARRLWLEPLEDRCLLSVAPLAGATGLRPPTAEELAWANRTAIVTPPMALNRLSLDRLNADPQGSGLRGYSNTSVGLGETDLHGASSLRGVVETITATSSFLAAAEAGEAGKRALGEGTPTLPAAVDNSRLPYFPPIRDQGAIGSCTSFATTYYALTYMTARARGWDVRDSGDANTFSPKWSYNLVNGGVDQGSSFLGNYRVLLDHGAATWSEVPYDANYREWVYNAPDVWRNAIDYRMQAFGQIDDVDGAGLAELKTLLADGYILNFGTNISGWQFTTLGNDPATAGDDAFAGQHIASWVTNAASAHAMTIVGYNDDLWVDINGSGTVDAGEKGALKIANSWGNAWENSGFAWLAYDALQARSGVTGGPNANRQAALFDDRAYWLTANVGYIPTVLAEFSVQHPARNELQMSVGTGTAGTTEPGGTWMPAALTSDGGTLGFDGRDYSANPAAAPVGTFVLDYSGLAPQRNVPTTYFVGLNDTANPSLSGQLVSFRLLDSTGAELAVVRAGQLPLADADSPATIRYAAADFSVAPQVSVQIVASGGATSVKEGSGADMYSMFLGSQPAADVVVTVRPDAQVTAAPTVLTFTRDNWNQPQAVTVTAVDDALVEGNHTSTITHSVTSADPQYQGLAVASVPVSLIDNDVAGEIQGHVWCDFDGDGQRDAADPQVVEQKVFLDANRNGVLDAGEVSTTTDSEGFYAFRNLSSGTYRVRVAWWVSSWRPTYHGDGADVVLAAGQVIPSVDFGAQFTAPMEVNVWAEDDAAAEPNDNAYFSLYVPTHGPFPLTINVQIAGTAAPGVDYQLSGTSGNTITIPPRTCIATVLLYALNDLVAEDLEYVTVTVLPGDGYSLGSSVQDTITIADDQGGPKRLYVDAEATGGNIGTSWHDAFVDLRAALLAAVPGDEVWVAEGTYVPGPDRVDCFEIKKGMTVYGGFAGTETHRDQRDWRSHPTVLSGDIGVRGDNADNSYRLVHLWDVGDDVVVDGFTIADANGYDGPFGGYSEGALAATAGSSPVLRNLTFIGNRASEGGAIAFNSCSRANNPIVENCVFLNNVAKYVGGAIFSIGTATPHIRNSVFVGNRSDRDGGAVWGHNYPLELTNCVFVNNSAVNGGALYSYDRNRPTVTNCTFVGNHASQKGGAIYHQDTSLAVVNSVLWGNVDAGGSDESAQIHTESGSVAVSYSCVQGWTGGLGGAGNLGSEPRLYNVTDPAGPDGVFFTLDDGLTLRRGSPCIDAADGTAAPATDLRGQTRYDDAATPNTGAGTIPYADRGAYEFTGFVPPPAISNIMDQTTLEDITRGPIAFTVSGVETPAGSITATSDNQALIPNPNLVLGGSGTHRTLTLTPAANQFGTATITVTVSDGTATASDTFLFTVTPVNDVPTISDITNQATFEDTAAGPLTVTIGDVELPADALTVTATSNNQTLIPNANLVLGGSGANRTLTLTPAANRFGTATITVTVSDGTATASETFVLTVSAVNDLPTISDLTDRSIPEDGSTGAIGFRVSDVETAASALTVTATSDNQTLVPNASLIRGGSGTNRTLSARPAANQFGTATITVTVRDADGGTAVDTLVLTVTPVNDRPTISDITNKSVAEDTPTPAIGFTVSDLETPPDSLTVTAVSSNATLVPAGNITLGGSGASRTIRLTPARDQFGTSTITVTVRDADGATAVDTFVLTVSSVNDFPTVSDIANRSITMGSNTGNIPFTVGDVETAAASLRVTVASSNTVLVPTANIALGGSGANRTIRVTPVVNRTGTATITVTVRDANNATSQDQFVLTVTRSGAATLTSTAALAAMGPTSRATTAHTGAAGDRVTVLSAPSATLPAAAAAPRGRPAPSVSSIDANRVPASVVTSKAELPDDLLSVLARDAAAALPANSAADRLFATLATGTVQ